MDVEEEQFLAEYYQHVLTSLTVNSRALITELTSLADKYVDHAPEIVDLIEERIKKCLPQYKLNAVYLLDSICKNIGNPYNLLFGTRLYAIFTQTYLVVTDTPTRQNLINLFKTWTKAVTNSGLELFPDQIIKKIEEFIIKATSISANNGANHATVTSIPNGRITVDSLLREANYLLQYIIALDDEFDKFQDHLNDEELRFIRDSRRERNNLIFSINTISESVTMDSKPAFDANSPRYQVDLQNLRKQIDNQSFQQQSFLKPLVARVTEQREIEEIQAMEASELSQSIEINFEPTTKFLESLLEEVKSGDDFYIFVSSWGKIKEKPNLSLDIPAVAEAKIEEPPSTGIANSLGLSMSFLDSFLGSPKNEIAHLNYENDDDVDSYDPELSLGEKSFTDIQSTIDIKSPTPSPADAVTELKPLPPANATPLASNLKRLGTEDKRSTKRVRFAED